MDVPLPSLSDALWTIAVGACCSVSCGVLGCWLVLRRISLVGDAISHAVLPGLVVAFLLTGSRNPVPMLAGAMVLGVLTAFLTRTLHRVGNVSEDAGMGLVFTSLFAIGVILLTNYASKIDLDPGCVLYGLIEAAPLDRVEIAGMWIPRPLVVLAGVLAATIAFVLLLWKELKLCAFDDALATSMGLSAGLVHYALMAMVAATTVASFEAVGSILVVAMLVVPGATAHLLTDRLPTMMWIAAAVGVLSSIFGYAGGVFFDTSVAGTIAVAAGAQFALAAIFAPRHGVLGRALRNLGVSIRIAREDALGHLWRRGESGGEPSLARSSLIELVGGGWIARRAVGTLARDASLAAVRGDRLGLTDAGMEEAARLVRAHRLWESYLTEELDRAPEAVHDSAHRIEHFLKPDLTARLEARLSNPERDPHGREIPKADARAEP